MDLADMYGNAFCKSLKKSKGFGLCRGMMGKQNWLCLIYRGI